MRSCSICKHDQTYALAVAIIHSDLSNGSVLFLSWLYMLDRGYQNQDEMEVLSGMTEGLKNFATQYNYAINDPELIRRYRMIEDGKRDIATRIFAAEERGKELGKEIGAKNEKLQNAKGLKQEGVDPAIISHVTGLSLEEIAKL